MIGLGEARGCPTVALLTAMDRPLGRACGNALEVEEAIEGLRGSGPADLMEVTYALGVEMLVLVGAAASPEEARRRLESAVSSGRALETFARIIEAQGGNPKVVEDPGVLPQAQAVEVYRAEQGRRGRSGGAAAARPRDHRAGRRPLQGGGRRWTRPSDSSSRSSRATRCARREPIASVFARDEAGIALGMTALREAVTIGERGG